MLGPGDEVVPSWGRPLTPPVGFPVEAGHILQALAASIDANRADADFRTAFTTKLGVQLAAPVISGRAALAVALAALHAARPGRDEVVVPAYTCFTVPAAVVRAGLKLRLVDCAPASLSFDAESVAPHLGPHTLAVIVPHLLGFPIDLEPIARAAENSRTLVIDDAAQALGARHRGRAVGSGGHLGILSFGRGKPLSALGGGAITSADPQIAALLEPALGDLAPAPAIPAAARVLEAVAMSPLLGPGLYWLPARLPFLKLGSTTYDPAFPIRRLDSFRIALAARGLARLEAANRARRRIGEELARRLTSLSGLSFLANAPDSEAIHLRFPVLLETAALRERAYRALRAAGIGASRLYPAPVTAIPALTRNQPRSGARFPRAEQLAERLLCLPTYPHIGEREVEVMTRTLAELLRTPSSVMVKAAAPPSGPEPAAGDLKATRPSSRTVGS